MSAPAAAATLLRTEPPKPALPAGPIDHAHLSRITMGSRDLELEVLHLFAEQAPITMEQLASADGSKAWKMAAHTLKGSARTVGAWKVAAAAEAAEMASFADPARGTLIARIAQCVDEASAYIARLPKAA